MLEDALFELMKEKAVEKITPTELCRKATVNRNTFYSHYSSVSQLYESIENSLIDSVDESLNESKTTVETVVSLVKLPPDDVINIELDLTKLDISINDGKPTYDQIKAYVLKKYGLKVSTLYISQVKRKFGIEVGEAYNKPKSPDSRVPKCPKEKEDAIVDALKYFKMI